MVYKTSEIFQLLKVVKDVEPFTEKDVSYARLNRWNREVNIREELLNIRPSIIPHLKEKGLITETSFAGCQLTEYGSKLLAEFEEKRKQIGESNIEFIPTMKEEQITYKVRVNPKAKLKYKTETRPPQIVSKTVSEPIPKSSEEYKLRKKHVINFLSGLKGIEDVKESGETLVIETRIVYHRTIEERNRLDEIAKELEMKIETNHEIYGKNYIFKDEQEKPVANIISRKIGKGFDDEPLEVRVDLTQPTEQAEKLINSLIERFT